MAHRFRQARRSDIPNALHLLGADLPLFSAETIGELPRLLDELLGQGLIKLVVVEEVSSGRLRLLGASAFVDVNFFHGASGSEHKTLPEICLSGFLKGQRPFLSPSEVARENARGGLALLNFLGTPDNSDLKDPAAFDLHRMVNEAHRFFHAGYQIADFYMESTIPEAAMYVVSLGATVVRERILTKGCTARLMHANGQLAVAHPGAGLAYLFKSQPPRFAFSIGDQNLLELALLDETDRDAAVLLGLGEQAIKKRWRSIYNEVERVDPELVPANLPGADRRRVLLRYLRQHLEELRPFARANSADNARQTAAGVQN